MYKLGIIVPYRNRPEQLEIFKEHILQYVQDTLDADYIIIVVDQVDKKKFNRGKLLNIGFLEAKKQNCDYVIFHDVDMLPVDVDYKYENKPLQLANNFIKDGDFDRTIQRNYFGGVTLFPVGDFEKINGYSNLYKGWGFEDDDLLLRCRQLNLELETESYRTPGINKPAIYLNGKNSYIKLHNIYRTIRPFSIVATFIPDPIECNPSEFTDEYTIFSIPGHDMNITFNSFSTYKFELFLKDNTPISTTSDYLPSLPVQVVANIDPRKNRINFHVNGKYVGERYWEKTKIRVYEEEPFLFFGAANPDREIKQNFFKGYISNIGIIYGELSKKEVRSLFLSNPNVPLTETNPNLKGRWNGYWDSLNISEDKLHLLDTSGYNNDGWFENCTLVDYFAPPIIRVKFPYRRKSTFQLIKHEEQGYINGHWKDWGSRENQLRYYRRVNSGDSKYLEDGLTTCKYRSTVVEEEDNYIKLNVLT